jgi:hypothetical protein
MLNAELRARSSDELNSRVRMLKKPTPKSRMSSSSAIGDTTQRSNNDPLARVIPSIITRIPRIAGGMEDAL